MKRLSPDRLFSVVRDGCFGFFDFFSRRPFAQIYRMTRPYTLCGNARLRALYQAVRQTVTEGVPGDVVECGTARGGSAALIGLSLKQMGADWRLWVFDTFEGLPAPDVTGPDWEEGRGYTGRFRGSLEEVRELFKKCGILSKATFVKGLFIDTLPGCGVQAISLLHIDCDWYESVKLCLDTFYERVSSGGIIQIDDYGHWEGARKAVDEFLKNHPQEVRIRYVDYTSRQLLRGPGVSRG